MKLMKNITREYQALPEEMLSKRQGLFIQFTLWNNLFPFPFINLNFWNLYPAFYIPEAWERYPFRAETPRIDHFREYASPGGQKSPV